jgi:hypothetical protein
MKQDMEDLHILGHTIKNVLVTATWHLGIVYLCIRQYSYTSNDSYCL